MASVSDGFHTRPSLETNGHHSSDDPFTMLHSSSTNMRTQLQTLLDEKEKQLQLAGTLGQRILTQRMELEERINVLSEYEHRNSGTRTPDPEGDPEMRNKLQDLALTMQNWETENEQLWGDFGQKLSNGLPSSRPPQTPLTPSASPARSHHRDLPPDPEPDYSMDSSVASGPSAAQSSRRAKNAVHREHDVKFAYDIGTSLLTEVRRLQSLLSERDKTIQEMKAEKDDVDKENDALKTSLHQQEASADKFKEENWNLEVQIQEARSQYQDAQQAATRAEGDLKRTTRQLASARETAETQKSENERLAVALEDLKVKHETDVAQMRKQHVALNRDKSDLQTALDSLKTDMAKRERRIGRLNSPASNINGPAEAVTPGNLMQDEDIFTTGGASRRKVDNYLTPGGASELYNGDYEFSPDPSPSKPAIVLAPNHPSNEIESLRQALNHAQGNISTLKRTIQREKEQKLQYKKQLAREGLLSPSAPGAWEDDEDEDIDDIQRLPNRASGSTARNGRGMVNRPTRGRGHKILSLAQKLGLASVEHQRDMEDQEVESPTSASHSANRDLLLEEIEGGDEEEDSPFVASSRPTSVDGMDPVFANILKSRDPPTGSPLRPLVLPEQVSPSAKYAPPFPRKTRAGAGFKGEVRPESLVGPPPGSLSAEFGDESANTTIQSPSALLEELEETDEVVSPPVVVPIVPAKEMKEFCVQTEPEETTPTPAPVPVPVVVSVPPKVETSDCSMQTDDLPKTSYANEAIATDAVPEIPAPAAIVAPLPLSVPVCTTSEMGTATEVLPALKRQLSDMDCQTDDDEAPSVQEVEIQTTPLPPVLDVEIRSMIISREEVEMPSDRVIPIPFPRPNTMEGSDIITDDDVSVPARTPRVLSMASIRTARPVAMLFEEPEEDRHTETDGEFVDARESVAAMTPTPHDSVTDFHSATGGSIASESEESDAESTGTSRMVVRKNYTSLSTHGRKISQTSRTSATGTGTALVSVPILPKPEMKEMSIQTDEWIPPTPVMLAVPPSPAKSFHRVGAMSNMAPPFHFISSPPRAADTSFASSVGTATPTQGNALGGSKTPQRDSSATFGGSIARAASPSVTRDHRRQSIESAFSAPDEHGMSPSRAPTLAAPPVDRTKPPVMMLPPPPSMPPPSTIPVNKKIPGPPPRPTSPPPPELIQRATTPTFQRSTTPSLHVPTAGRSYIRQHGSSLPPNAQGLQAIRQPSNSSFRSTPNGTGLRSPLDGVFNSSVRRGDYSTTSLLSGGSSAVVSRRASISSSRSSEIPPLPGQQRTPGRVSMSPSVAPVTPANNSANPIGDGADVDVVHAITQTMIGEFLYKYTRRVVGKGHGEKRHRRFFWIHPYTKTLYWSSADPGSASASESSAKSAYIDSVKSILDPNPLPPGVYQYSLVVSTPQREMKFTAPTKERHDIWFKALKYLLDRPTTIPVTSPESDPLRPGLGASPRQRVMSEDGGHSNFMTSPRSVRSVHSTQSYSITPRAMRSQTHLSSQNSIGKRPGTPAAEYLRWAEGPQSPTKSIRSQAQNYRTDDEDYEAVEAADESFELHDEPFEAMENVRACCDGEHDLGALSRRPGQPPHHHHHHHHPIRLPLSRPQTPAERPTSPSGWSFRSKAGSTNSEGGSRLSQWAGDAKRSIRFTSRGKSPAPGRPSLNVPRGNS